MWDSALADSERTFTIGLGIVSIEVEPTASSRNG